MPAAGSESAAELARLATERLLPESRELDRLPAAEILRHIHREDLRAVRAVGRTLPQIARAVEGIVRALERGGRLIYVGAGTSGRLGVLDASECPPTYQFPPQRIVGVIAGGDAALRRSSERIEDDPEIGRRDLARLRVGRRDAVVGIAASGRTPYTLGALAYARRRGALAIALVATSGSPLAAAAEIAIEAVTGPEVVSGSTRMKAGTAQKLVLNMLSTTAMIRLGHVYGPWMVNMRASNYKLRARAARILAQAAGSSAGTTAGKAAGQMPGKTADKTVSKKANQMATQTDSMDFAAAAERLEAASYELKPALVAELAGVNLAAARRALRRARGRVRAALQELKSQHVG